MPGSRDLPAKRAKPWKTADDRAISSEAAAGASDSRKKTSSPRKAPEIGLRRGVTIEPDLAAWAGSPQQRNATIQELSTGGSSISQAAVETTGGGNLRPPHDRLGKFDEADAIQGKRTDVADAHDRYADIEDNALLTRKAGKIRKKIP